MNVKQLSDALRSVAFIRRGWLEARETAAVMEISRDLCKVNETLKEAGYPLPSDNAKRTWQVAWSQFRFERRNQIPSLL